MCLQYKLSTILYIIDLGQLKPIVKKERKNLWVGFHWNPLRRLFIIKTRGKNNTNIGFMSPRNHGHFKYLLGRAILSKLWTLKLWHLVNLYILFSHTFWLSIVYTSFKASVFLFFSISLPNFDPCKLVEFYWELKKLVFRITEALWIVALSSRFFWRKSHSCQSFKFEILYFIWLFSLSVFISPFKFYIISSSW